jgi:hypothetical protein
VAVAAITVGIGEIIWDIGSCYAGTTAVGWARMEFAEALEGLGVDEATLTAAEREALDQEGYVVFPDVLTPLALAAVRDRLDALVAAEGERAGLEMHQEAGTNRVADLVNKGAVFDQLWTHPKLLASAWHIVAGPFRLSSVTSRSALPGEGNQALHPDWHEPVGRGAAHICNSIWLLDDFTEENGATRVVPGSHHSDAMPADVLDDLEAPQPGERLLVSRAGSLTVFNAHLWHSGTLNRSGAPRRAIFPVFIRDGLERQMDQAALLRPETRARLGDAQLELLGA